MGTVKGERTATSLPKRDFFVTNHPGSHTFNIGGFGADTKAHVTEGDALLSSIFHVWTYHPQERGYVLGSTNC